jgi:hypothetical protein
LSTSADNQRQLGARVRDLGRTNACSSVQPFLDIWLGTDTDNARRQLAAFILKNDSMLLNKRQLWNAFWDTSGKPHREVVNWLQSDPVFDYLDACTPTVLIDDFAYALPQLTAIRSSFAATRT